MKDIYTIVEENNIEKTDDMYEYMDAYQNCWMLINEKFEFPDFKNMFKKKDSKDVSNTVSSSFSFLSFLMGGNSSDTDTKDPVRDAYLKTIEEKRKNNEKRRQDIIKGQQDIKIRNIKLKAKQEESQIASAHAEMMNQIKATTDALDKELENMDKIIASIKKGKPIPPAVLSGEISRQNKIIDAMIKASPDNDLSKQEAAQAAFIKLYYKRDDNNQLIARTPKEFKQARTDDPNTAALFTKVAAEGQGFIDNATPESLAEMAKSFDAADQSSQRAAATNQLKEATENAALVASVKAAVEKETSDVSKRNELRKSVAAAQKENEKAKNEYAGLKELTDQQQMMYAFINKNKGKDPLKTILSKEGNNILSLTKTLAGCVGKDGKIEAGEFAKNIDDIAKKAGAPTETREGATDPSVKFDFPIDDQTVKIEDAKKAVNSAKEAAAAKVTDSESKLNTAVKDLEDAGGSKDKLDEETLDLSNETKQLLNKIGIKETNDLTIINASIKTQTTNASNAVTNAQKAVDTAKDNSKWLEQKYKQAEETIKKAEENRNADVKDANEKIKETFKNDGINPAVEKKDGDRVYVEDEKGNRVYRPTDLSDPSAMEKYDSKRKLALVKAVGDGKMKEPVESHVEMIAGNPHYFVDGEDLGSDEDAKDLYVSAQVEAKVYARDIATVKNVLKGDTEDGEGTLEDDDYKALAEYMDKNEEALDKISSEIDGYSEKDFDELLKDKEGDDDDDEALSDDEKNLKDAKKILKDKSEDEILALADKDEKPEDVSDEEWKAAKKYKEAKEKIDKSDEEEPDSEDGGNEEDGKPKEPKRKIKKRPSKIKGRFIYVYRTQEGKRARASKKDWQANVKAWNKYKRRLAKWEKEHNSNESLKYTNKKSIYEVFKPKDLTQYLKECFC